MDLPSTTSTLPGGRPRPPTLAHRTSPRSARNSAGRPRDPELTARLLNAALDLVAESGVQKLNADRLAARVGAGKAAIYRRWPSTTDLLADAVSGCRPIPPAPGTGSLAGDLRVFLGNLQRPASRDERVVAAVLGEAQNHPGLRTALDVAVLEPLDATLLEIFRRSASDGPADESRRTSIRHVVRALWLQRYLGPTHIGTVSETALLVTDVLAPAALG